MTAPRCRALLLIAAVAGALSVPGRGATATSERLVIERRDGTFESVVLVAIRSLAAADSELVVRTDGAERHIPFADIRHLRFEPSTTAADPERSAWIEAIRLLQNRPNPAVRTTTIGFDLARRGRVTLEVFSVSGRRVRTLVDQAMEPGRHDVAWDGTDDRGRRVEAGVYFYRLKGLGRDLSRRAVILP